MVVHAKKRRRSERLEIRTTPDERAVIDRAVVASGSDWTEFVITSLTIAARQVMADRATFDPRCRRATRVGGDQPARTTRAARASRTDGPTVTIH